MDKIGPYELNSITPGDAKELMKEIPDGCIDLVVTSPPYDTMRSYNGYSFDFNGIATQLVRVIKPGGVIVWVVGDKTISGSESGSSFRQALYFMGLGLNLNDTMIFRKINGAMGSIYTYLQEFEYMFVFSKGKPKTVNLLRDRKNVRPGIETAPKIKSTIDGRCRVRKPTFFAEYGRRKNIWSYPVGGKQEVGSHPAPFPEALARDHILSWSNPGDLIFDPMCGSGTTCKAAKVLGRLYLGFDISSEYVDIASARLQAIMF